MIVYAESPKEWKQTKKLLELKHKFSKASTYKVSMVKNQLYFYTLAATNWENFQSIYNSVENKTSRSKLNKRRAEYPC